MAYPSKASVRALVEALISHNIGLINMSNTKRIFGTTDLNAFKERLDDALFNEDFMKESVGTLTGYLWGNPGSEDLRQMMPRDAFNNKGSCNILTAGLVTECVNNTWGYENLIEKAVSVCKENSPSIHYSDPTPDYYTLFVLNKTMVTEVMNQTSYSVPDFFTGTREAKTVQMCNIKIRSLWDIYRNPGRYRLGFARYSGISVTSLDRPPVQGGSNEKQQLNFARSLVGKDFSKCLEIVLDRQMCYCLGYVDGSSWPLTEEEAHLLAKSNRYRYQVSNKEDLSKARISLENNNMVLKFTPTKEDEMREDLEAFKVIKRIRKAALAAVEEQSQIFESLYLEHGKGINAWLAKELVEKIQMNPMAYVNEEFFKGLAMLVMGG
ncbi:MAG: hypothetical protein WC372_10405 [Candidatus Neomarinimicrobiota bacterium]|jgi:hypothetical protein